jgi:hypothetical protein
VRLYEIQSKKGVSLTFDYRPCVGPRVPNIVIFAGLYLLFPRTMFCYAFGILCKQGGDVCVMSDDSDF